MIVKQANRIAKICTRERISIFAIVYPLHRSFDTVFNNKTRDIEAMQISLNYYGP